MTTSTRDRISVDLQGLKAALQARSEATGLSPSDLVRQALAALLQAQPMRERTLIRRRVRGSVIGLQRVSLRMDRVHASALSEAAEGAGLSLGEYVSGLLDGVAVLGGQGDRIGSLAALIASNSELADLSRDLRHLVALLSRGQSEAARVYRERLEDVDRMVRKHLRIASEVLSELQPRRPSRIAAHRSDESSTSPISVRRGVAQ